MMLFFTFFCFADEPAKVYTVETIDVCRCLGEKGNSPFMKANGSTCDVAISKKIDVPDWTKVNFSKDQVAKAKWEKMEKDCNNTSAQCIEKEKAKLGCTAKDIKDPKWGPQNCTNALMAALKACEK